MAAVEPVLQPGSPLMMHNGDVNPTASLGNALTAKPAEPTQMHHRKRVATIEFSPSTNLKLL